MLKLSIALFTKAINKDISSHKFLFFNIVWSVWWTGTQYKFKVVTKIFATSKTNKFLRLPLPSANKYRQICKANLNFIIVQQNRSWFPIKSMYSSALKWIVFLERRSGSESASRLFRTVTCNLEWIINCKCKHATNWRTNICSAQRDSSHIQPPIENQQLLAENCVRFIPSRFEQISNPRCIWFNSSSWN